MRVLKLAAPSASISFCWIIKPGTRQTLPAFMIARDTSHFRNPLSLTLKCVVTKIVHGPCVREKIDHSSQKAGSPPPDRHEWFHQNQCLRLVAARRLPRDSRWRNPIGKSADKASRLRFTSPNFVDKLLGAGVTLAFVGFEYDVQPAQSRTRFFLGPRVNRRPQLE